MTKLTAFILIGSTKQKQGDFIPSHYITLYESDHPSFSLYKFNGYKKINMTTDKIIEYIKTYDLKTVFNILAGSKLLNQMDRIKDYPNDFEVTTPKFRKEYSYQTGKEEFIEF